MQLSELHNGEYGIISKIRGRGAFRKRITEMGFVKGKRVDVVKNAPLNDPIEYSIMGYQVSLRRSEASLIEVVTPDEAKKILAENHTEPLTTLTEPELVQTGLKVMGKTINIALVGNPNSGKTTIFNFLSGSREHVGNYSGVTVDSKIAHFQHKGYTFNITDLPGTYSLTAYTPEEVYVRNYIHENHPDLIINVVDASNLERNLYLTTQLIDMDVRIVVALNMYDELLDKRDRFDYEMLGKMLGIPFVPTVGSRAKGFDRLKDTIINVFSEKDKTSRHIHINYGAVIEESIAAIQHEVRKNETLTVNYSSRYLSIKLLEKDRLTDRMLKDFPNYAEIRKIARQEVERLEALFHEDSETLITDAKYGFIAGALKETYHESSIKKRQTTEIIDTFITHKLFGFPIFIFLIWLTFFTTFTLGEYPMNWIEAGVAWISRSINGLMPNGPLKDMLVDGIISGVGSVIVFLPNILILFFFISLLEDTGYMARAAFIMDKLMHKIGLHGKSFIPLVMGFGCNVPAIMASRTIENKNNRLVTMLITPFMSCSARLPVYILILGTFFPKHAGNLLVLIYFTGILLAVGTALLLKKTLFRTDDVPFVMELPPYRIPTLRSILIHMWDKASQYLNKIGGVILVGVIIILALGYFPRNVQTSKDYDSLIGLKRAALTSAQATNAATAESLEQEIQEIEMEREALRQEQSYLGRIGKFIEPALKPLGFDWKMGVSLISGIAAKEIVVSTLGVLHLAKEPNGSQSLPDKLKADTYTTGEKVGQKVFTPLSSFSFLIFILIYFPCVAVISAIKQESGSWKWALFTIVFTTALAWVSSFLFFQVGTLITGS